MLCILWEEDEYIDIATVLNEIEQRKMIFTELVLFVIKKDT